MKVKAKYNSQNFVLNYLLAGYVFFIPLWPLVPPVILIVMFLVLIFFKNESRNNLYTAFRSPVMLFASLYILMVLGMIWTKDFGKGLEYLWRESPLFLFPLFFALMKINAKTFEMIKKGFISGCLLACAICLAHSLVRFCIIGKTNVFFYTYYSVLLHPTYFSICLNLAVLLLIDELLKNWNIIQRKYRNILVAVLSFLLFNIILLFAKMSLITTIITVVYFLICEGKRYFKLSKVLTVTVIFVTTFILLIFFFSRAYNRFGQVTEAIESYSSETIPQNFKYYNSSTIRIIEWKMGYEIFTENWLIGVGTGDIYMATMQKFMDKNFTYGITHFETPASQYLYLAIILGVVGLAIFLLSYFIPLFVAYRYSFYLYSAFLLMFIFNSITDSILSASGVVLYGMFNAFFFTLFHQKRISKSNSSELNVEKF